MKTQMKQQMKQQMNSMNRNFKAALVLGTLAASAQPTYAASCMFGDNTSKLYDAPSAETLGLTFEKTVTVDQPNGAASIDGGPNDGQTYVLSSALKEEIRRVVASQFGITTSLADALKEMSSEEAGALRFFSAPNSTNPRASEQYVYINFYPNNHEYGIIYQIKFFKRGIQTYSPVANVNNGVVENCTVFKLAPQSLRDSE